MCADFLNQRQEAFWINNRELIAQAGYQLHPKYDPAWQPQSEEERYEAMHGELSRYTLATATRLSDDATVMLKRVEQDSRELSISTLFSNPPHESNPRNHCVRVYEVLQMSDPTVKILVMPLLRQFDTPYFETVGEAIECFRQIFEGVQYMHEHHVAHRDCTKGNIMMDGDQMYPHGYHPAFPNMRKDFRRVIYPSATRTMVWPRYFLIDFETSQSYDPRAGIPYEKKSGAGDKTAPEHRTGEFFNPFPTDVYYLGSLLRRYFIECTEYECPKRRGLRFLLPLVDDMVKIDPTERPTMDEVVLRYHELTKGVKPRHLRSPCEIGDHIFWPFGYLGRRIKFMLTGRPPVPPTDPPAAVLKAPTAFYTQRRVVQGS
ncbi:kinase-like domain-containing protein [Mycena olivaceomarginata]|nr:kinase-like domain-containing protein [Mycena olivaceomarginata]